MTAHDGATPPSPTSITFGSAPSDGGGGTGDGDAPNPFNFKPMPLAKGPVLKQVGAFALAVTNPDSAH